MPVIESLDEALGLVGPLDGRAGFDAPRQRFRRFLTSQVTTSDVARAYIEQCQHQVDEQHDQALRDLVVAAGHALGFEPAFGADVAPGATFDGYWRSRQHRLEIVLQVRTNHAVVTDGASLVRTVAARAAVAGGGAATTVVGLCVVSPLYPRMGRLEAWLAGASTPNATIRILSLRSLLKLFDLAADGHLRAEEFARLFQSVAPLDFVVELLAGPPRRPVSRDAAAPPRRSPNTGPGFWLATVAGEYALTPERFLEVVVGKRRIYGVPQARVAGAAQPGDRICFYVAGRGVVGRADVAAVEPRATGLRDVAQYQQVLRLENIDMHLDRPTVPDCETTLRLRVTQGDGSPAWAPFMPIPAQDFRALAAARSAGRESDGFRVDGNYATPKADPTLRSINGGGSRSRE